MQQVPWLKIAGIAFLMMGMYLAQAPDVLFITTPETSAFMRINHHVFGGAILGLGLVILRRRPQTPLKLFVVSSFGWLTLGALIGRCLGLWVFDGPAPIHTYLGVAESGVLIACSIYVQRHQTRMKNETAHSP